MKYSICIFGICLLVFPMISYAQISEIKLSGNQLTEIYKLADITRNFTINMDEIQEEKKKLTTLSSLTLIEIQGVIGILKPSELANKSEYTISKQTVRLFVNQYYEKNIDGIDALFEKNKVNDKDNARKNFKDLLTNEVFIVLQKSSLSYNGTIVSIKEFENKLEEGEKYENIFKILNENIDDKKWDAKVRFVFLNADLELFR